MKAKWFWGAISIILISWLGNTLYYQSKQLKDPIILSSYINIISDYERTFSIFYLTNKGENMEAMSLRLGQETLYPLGNDSYFGEMGNYVALQESYYTEYIHHYLKKVDFNIDEEQLAYLKSTKINANKILMEFSGHRSLNANIEHFEIHNEPRSIKSDFSSGSVDNIGNVTEDVQLLEDAHMKKLELPQEIASLYKVNVGKSGEGAMTPIEDQSWPMDVKAKERIITQYKRKSKVQPGKYIDADILMPATNKKNKEMGYVFHFRSEPSLTQRQVNQLVYDAKEERK
ncbi:hypothetical protein [Viridibacillus arvi]|uniref:hypothetical protein n=1 Tax=Viridibacillus arvi TaxID=263475 RepID=UPI0034CF3E9D